MVELFDVAVIGAGPSGAAAALHAVRRGFETVLIDSSEFPRDKTCGDGLTPRGMHQLNQLGVEVNAAYRNKGLKLHGFGTSATAPWPTTYLCAEGTALQRHHLDALLVDAAVAAGATLLAGTPATNPVLEGNRLTEFSVGDTKIRAREVIIADGVRSTFGQKLGRQW
ncbi:MAG: FAD-dependent monooxygenase, partial [Corynebacterium casei]|nr:FAD-dependent monooxygenase [Corynebacterium casei]